MKKKYCLISHTHWDREWYLPFEKFRMRLVDLIDNLFDILENDPAYRFHLDAQTIVLEDYLAIKPYKRAVLEQYVRQGRLLIGPWYVQNDFYLTSGEATLRNLMIGKKIANQFGGCMPVSYAADQFGLISQLPQLLYKSGFDTFVFGRGFDRGVTEFIWESEDGSPLLAVHMKFWYNNAQRLSPNPIGALHLIRDKAAECAAVSVSENLLLMNGVDHLEAQEDLTEIINTLRPMLNENEELFQDTLPEYLQRLSAEIKQKNIALPHFGGELRDNGAPDVLTGTLSARIYLKQENVAAQAALENQIEPLYSLLSAAKITDYPKDYLYYLWKLLITNHPHDSICGCSIDAVHAHMMDRFARIRENTDELFARGMDELSAHIDTKSDDGYRLMLYNGCAAANEDVIKAVIDIPTKEDIGGIGIYDENQVALAFTVDRIEKNVVRTILSPINLPGSLVVNRYHITLDAGVTNGYSYRVLRVKTTSAAIPTSTVQNSSVLENDYLKVEVHENGTIRLTDKQTGIVRDGLLALEDTADRGDSYNYTPGADKDSLTTVDKIAQIAMTENTPLCQALTISHKLSVQRSEGSGEGSGEQNIQMKLTLGKYAKALDVRLTIDNMVKNHRLRVLIPTDIQTEYNYASLPYDIIKRNKISKFEQDKEHPSTDFVCVEDETTGLAVLHHGLYEYEHMADARNTLALTVLRSVGMITGLWDAEGAAAEAWRAEGCQCIGQNTAHFSIYPYAGDHITAKVAAKAKLFCAPLQTAFRADNPNKFIGGRPFVQGAGMPDIFYRPIKNTDQKLPIAGTMLQVDAVHSCILPSAFKKAEDQNGYIVRLYNTTDQNQSFTLRSPLFKIQAAEIVMPTEEAMITPATVNDGTLYAIAKPKEIITFRLQF